MRQAPGFLVIALSVWLAALAPARAGDAPYGDRPIETVRVRIEGQAHAFGYRAYPAPLVLDLSQARGRRDTPYQTLLSYHRALASVRDYGAELAPFLRKASGEPGAPPPDEAKHNEAARRILSGDVVVSGEIHFDAYTIFIARYTKSIPRNLGIAIRRFEAREHVVVQDLIQHNPLAHALSAARWRVENFKAKYPAD